ncbi:MAG TPA: VWA domain-containing protein [Pyrinomonadaceae bacterium]|nr:VWA domain-containing protein [Pyrinomonadaceae bacterium]
MTQSFHQQTQGRETKDTQRQGLLVCPYHRSLKTGPDRLRVRNSGFAPFRLLMAFVLLAVVSPAHAQEVEDTIRIKTRVVFLDALVKDKKTNAPVANLSTENFEVLDEGKPRSISYFTREGQARKPLAMVLILDVRDNGAGRFLKRAEIIKAMESELAKLPPGDEVAIMAMDIGEDERRFWVTEFTNDRARIASALAQVQAMCERKDEAPPTATNTEASQSKEVVETETIKGRKGGVVTRTTMKDGTVNVKRVNKDGDVTIELGDIYDMAAAVRDATKKAEQLRPNSQASIVWISDGIAPIFFEDRDATEQILIRNNVIFNSLTVELRTLFKFLLPVGKPVAGWLGLSLYGSAKQLAQRSGGEAVKVGRVKDYSAGLSRIIGNLTARYSLGFALAENETDDGRLHSLQVRVQAKDEKGKQRKLLVSSRQGYYMSSAMPKETAAKTQ